MTDCKKNIEKWKAGQKVVIDLQWGRRYGTGKRFWTDFPWRTLESYKTQENMKNGNGDRGNIGKSLWWIFDSSPFTTQCKEYQWSMEEDSDIKKIIIKWKNDIWSFATIWMDLEGIMLREINQIKRNGIGFHLYVKSKKQNKWTNITKQNQSYRYREQKDGCHKGRG